MEFVWLFYCWPREVLCSTSYKEFSGLYDVLVITSYTLVVLSVKRKEDGPSITQG